MEIMQHGEQFLYFQQGGHHSLDWALSFADQSVPKFCMRMTGGCANMTAADSIGMRNLTRALCGETSNKGGPTRQFAGFALQGGTQMVSVHDTSEVVPGITEILPVVARKCPNVRLLGLVAGFRCFKRNIKDPNLIDKLIIETSNGVHTIIHPDMASVLLLQPNPDNKEHWDDEYKETHRTFTALHDQGYSTLNVAYNGGSVTERELKLWAYWGNRQPGLWNMLIIRDSGRICSKYAEDEGFLREHPSIHVADNNVDAIAEKLWELKATAEVRQDNVLTFRRRA